MPASLQLAQPLRSPAQIDQTSAPLKLVVADDHHVVRRALRLWLESEKNVEVIAEAGDVPTAIRHVKRHLPHVLLLDLRMPNGSSIEAIRRLRAEVPETQIVVATTEESPLFARQALDAGAIGYVLKDNADAELQTAVRCAARGEEYVSPCVAARLDGLRRAAQDDGLSPRETDVLRLIALGLTSAEISGLLHLSRRTVESHRRRIHRKLGLGKRSELVRYAFARHLIGDPPDAARGSACR
ncbi:MAG TPA: response regulator transcription factor [Solirubrobacteraceae bacterium]|nr:response regulator transcription factor [Solirubrobacteraceae bacterium]